MLFSINSLLNTFLMIDIVPLGSEFISFIVGCYIFSYLNKSYRIILLQVSFGFFVDLTGYIIRKNYSGMNITWLFNSYLIADCSLLLLAAYLFLYKQLGQLFIFGYIIFIFFWLYSIFRTGISHFAVAAYVVDSVLVISAYLFLLYKSIISYAGSLLKLPVLWLCCSIILFYACNIPNFSLLNLLIKNLLANERIYLNGIIKILTGIRYLLIAFSFLLVYFNHKYLTVHTNAFK